MGASSTSSSEDDEEAERLRSVAVDSASVAGIAAVLSQKNHNNKNNNNKKENPACGDDEAVPSSLKFYQARARDVLYEYLDKIFEIKHAKYEDIELADAHSTEDAEDSGFRLFKRAPAGLSDRQHQQEAVSTQRRKLQDHNLDESSEMFQASLLATAIDGTAVTLHAEKVKTKAFTSWVLHQAKEEEAKIKEEERIAQLKAQRGERWLPSIAKNMQIDCDGNSPGKVAIKEKRCRDLQRKDAIQNFKK